MGATDTDNMDWDVAVTVHWNTWTDPHGQRHTRIAPSWRDAFRFMEAIVLADAKRAPVDRNSQVCYQRLPTGVEPTA